jgi:uncharacterized protein YacL
LVFQTALRVILGVAFAGLGYFLIHSLLPNINLLGSSSLLPLLVAIALGALGVYIVPAATAISRRFFDNFVKLLARELLAQIPFPRRGRSEPEENNKSFANPIILDTSAIIDGRIVEIAKTGFLDGTLVVPNFILGELQHIADSPDPLRRNRGRRGFEVIEELKKIGDGVRVEVTRTDFPLVKKADDKLVNLGRKLKAKVMTTDYNLNKVARITGIQILNVNELANSIKTVLLPGELITVKVMQEGKEREQGVGYLPDGTMIVVENGASLIGQTVESEVERVFQTVAGRMIFVKPHRELAKSRS